MAQTGYTPISIYYSSTAAATPTAGNLVAGELAINTADGKLFYKDSAGVVQVIGTKGGVGSSTTTQVLYNSSGLVVGSANMTFNGTTFTLANDASISGLTVGKGGGAVASNTAVGYQALGSNTTGAENAAFGRNALVFNTTGAGNSAFGFGASYSNVDGALNSAFGDYTLFANTSGNNNSGFGFNALRNNTTGSQNTAYGMQSLNANTTASNNTAVGYQAGYTNTTSSYNTFIGYQAGYLSNYTSGNAFNTCVGTQAGYNLSTGKNNTFIGGTTNAGAGGVITTGSSNTVLGGYSGNQGGLDIRTLDNQIVISDGDGNPRFGSTGANNLVLFGTNSYLSSYNSSLYAYGSLASSSGVYLANNATSWASTSDERRKDIIEPITDAVNKVSQLRAVIGKFKTDEEGTRRPFLIAQDVQAVLPEAVQSQEDENGEFLGMSYTDVVPLLVAAIKELKSDFEAYKASHP